MRIPAIEELRQKVQDVRSREAVDEVLSCYYSKNFRSAVVMMYSAVVSDVYYKCNDLWDIYKDNGAKQIIDEVEKEWKDRPISSDWERTIVEKCYQKKKIVDGEDLVHFQNLQRERNLCAHPVIGDANALYQPNAATVQGLIIDMMRGVLCKPSFMSKYLMDSFLDDIDSVKRVIKSREDLEDYIFAKYLDKIDNEKAEYDLFKRLWKFAFFKTDEKCLENRKVNRWVLSIIYERNEDYIIGQVAKDPLYFGENINREDTSCLRSFVYFVNLYQEIYDKMTQDFRIAVVPKITSDKELNAIAFFLSTTLKKHADSLSSGISSSSAKYISRHLRANYSHGEALDFLIRIYGGTECFDDADDYYDELIAPNLGYFSEEQLKNILQVSNKNGQIFARRRAASSFRAIKSQMIKINPDFDFSPYQNL